MAPARTSSSYSKEDEKSWMSQQDSDGVASKPYLDHKRLMTLS